jgi:RecB family exonuclease
MHGVLHRLYEERPHGDPIPRPSSLDDWIERGMAILAEVVGERLGTHPAERAIARRIEGLLSRFLTEESRRDAAGFEPWLLEAQFGEGEEADRGALAVEGWGLHGAIDRVDRAPDGRALVIDYKLAREVVPRAKFVEKARLQLQLYLIAVGELWGGEAVGGIYHPLGGTTDRRPRGAVLRDAAGDLPYGLVGTDLADHDEFEGLLEDARSRATEIVRRMRSGDIRRDPGPPPPSRDHDVCPSYCQFAPICRRDRSAAEPDEEGEEEQ